MKIIAYPSINLDGLVHVKINSEYTIYYVSVLYPNSERYHLKEWNAFVEKYYVTNLIKINVSKEEIIK